MIIKTLKEVEKKYPKAGSLVNGLTVLHDVPNKSSISSSLYDYEILDGIREVKNSYFEQVGYSKTQRIIELAEEIKKSKEIKPLIVVIDHEESPYILEGSHRFDALRHLGVKKFPALVVIDTEMVKLANYLKNIK